MWSKKTFETLFCINKSSECSFLGFAGSLYVLCEALRKQNYQSIDVIWLAHSSSFSAQFGIIPISPFAFYANAPSSITSLGNSQVQQHWQE